MGKKGIMMLKMIIFLVGSLLVGALVIAAFTSIVPRLMANAEENIAAKDIALTIMTLSASSNDVFFRYDKNVEDYEIRISQDEVHVKSRDGSGKYKYIPMKGVIVQDALISNALMIPMNLKDGIISFEDEKIDYTDICSAIPSDYGKERLKVKISFDYGETTESRQNLEKIATLMKLYTTNSGSKVEFVDNNEDLLLKFSTGNSPSIIYYEDSSVQKTSWYHKISCYSSEKLGEESMLKNSVGVFSSSPSSQKEIAINFGDTTKFLEALNNNLQLSGNIAKEIYNAIELGISK